MEDYDVVSYLPDGMAGGGGIEWTRAITFYRFKAAIELKPSQFILHWREGGKLLTYDDRSHDGRACVIQQLPSSMKIHLLVLEAVPTGNAYSVLLREYAERTGQRRR